MHTLSRLWPFFRAQWRIAIVAVLLMALYSLFSGTSVGLVLPIVEGVFFREEGRAAVPTLGVGEGLHETWDAVRHAVSAPGGMSERMGAAKTAGLAGLRRIQHGAPAREILIWLCLITLAAVFLKNLADFGRKMVFIRVEQRMAEDLRNEVFRRVLHFPLAAFSRTGSGQLLSRLVTDVEAVKQLTINTAANFVHNLLQLMVYLTITIWSSPRLALASLIVVPPIMLLTAKLSSRLRRQAGRAQSRIADLTTSAAETLGAMRVVKAFGNEPREGRRFAYATTRYRRAVVRLLSMDSLAAPLSEFWGAAVGVGVLFVGGQMVLAGEAGMSTGRFFLFFFALLSTLHPLKELANIFARFQRGAAAADRVFEILELPVEEDAPDALPVPAFQRDIVFENVSFDYGNGRDVLIGVQFTARAGTTTALVGPSGAGKSTLVDLIPRFHDPTAGGILLDGIDLRQLRRRELRALIGVVSQETLLFDDTVYNNIAYGREAASAAEIEAAAVAANAHEFIEAMPDGYRSVIGERGHTLSGGQRQRLAIARALLRNPSILILDEATSSLDSESEALVQEALDRLLIGRTTIVIAHRLSTVMRADQILVLDGGRIAETGTHGELIARPGLYRRLYELQFRYEEAPRLDAVET